jgi:hypothetical protein
VPRATQRGAGSLSGCNLGSLGYTSQSKAWGATPKTAKADVLNLDAKNIGRVTVHPERGFARRPLGCGLIRSYSLGLPVFGGTTRRRLTASYRLGAKRTIRITVLRGKTVVRRSRRTPGARGRCTRSASPQVHARRAAPLSHTARATNAAPMAISAMITPSGQSGLSAPAGSGFGSGAGAVPRRSLAG